MAFNITRMITALTFAMLISCNSDKAQIETVIEEGNKAGSFVHTEWKPETQQPEEAITIESSIKPQIVEKQPNEPITPTVSRQPKELYYLQVGAFVNKNNANSLAKKLEKLGHKPTISPNEFKGNKWNIVKLGPYQQKDQAETTARSLAASEKTDILIIYNNAVIETIRAHLRSDKPTAKISTGKTTQPQPEKPKAEVSEPHPSPSLPAVSSKPESESKIVDPTPSDGTDKPYSFQVGGLYSVENAKEQLKRYQLRGYSPYLVEVTDDVNNDKWYTIRIGNFKTLNEAVNEAAIFAAKEQIPTHPRPINY